MSEELQMFYPVFRIWGTGRENLNTILYEWTYKDVLMAYDFIGMESDMNAAVDLMNYEESRKNS